MSLPTIIRKRQSIVRALGRKGYRDAYVGQHIKRGIAAQVRAMREDRGWTQAELGEQLGRKQPNVARLEDEDYGKYNLGTLAKVASAFDVALVVRFVRFSQLVDYTSNITPDDLAPVSFEGDAGLRIFDLRDSTGPVPGSGTSTQQRHAFVSTSGQLPLALEGSQMVPIQQRTHTLAPVENFPQRAIGVYQ